MVIIAYCSTLLYCSIKIVVLYYILYGMLSCARRLFHASSLSFGIKFPVGCSICRLDRTTHLGFRVLGSGFGVLGFRVSGKCWAMKAWGGSSALAQSVALSVYFFGVPP